MRKLVMSLFDDRNDFDSKCRLYICCSTKPGGGTINGLKSLLKNLPHSLVRKLSSKLFPAQEIFPASISFITTYRKTIRL